jgi:hypothetical protein
MSQYKPVHRASRIPPLSRTISVAEHEAVLRLLADLGIENGWVQEMGAAEEYLPDFDRKGHPFSPANSRDTIPLKPATNQVLCPRNTTYWLHLAEYHCRMNP